MLRKHCLEQTKDLNFTKFVFGLLETANLTNDNALATAKAMELSAKGWAEIQQQKDSRSSLNYIQQRDRKSKGIASNTTRKSSTATRSDDSRRKEYCFRCGKADHLANKCIHRNSACSFCHKKRHLQAVCFKAKNEKKHANYIEDDGDEDDLADSLEELFNIQQADFMLSNRSKFEIQLKVNNVCLGLEIDSGSPVTIISEDDKQQYFRHNELQPTDTKLVSYCGTQIQVLGFLNVCVSSGIECHDLKLFVVKSKRKPLLGREWLRELKLNWNDVFNASSNTTVVSSIHQQNVSKNVEKLKCKYSTVLEKSMGKIENVQAHIRLKANVQPIFVKARKMPFALHDAVEKERIGIKWHNQKSGIIQMGNTNRSNQESRK